MRRLVSSPDAVGNLTFQDTEVPTPKANECLIRVKAFSMNRGELKRSQDDLLGTPIGWDVVGVVEQTAQDGSGPPTGTKIVALSIRSEGWAEYVAIPTRFLAIIPQSVSDTDAATLPVAGLTALYAVEKGSRLPGSRVLITGATGGVGLFAMQLAQMMGASVVAQIRQPVQKAFVRDYGADEVVLTETGQEAKQFAPYRLIVDGVGGELVGTLTAFLAKGGTCVCYGSSSGNEMKLSLPDFYFENGGQRTLYGFTLYTEVEMESASSGLARLLRLVKQGRLKTHIDRAVSWREAGVTAADLIGRRFSGKAVLHVD
ncbi:zinc-binding dehydrogenase [Pseudanabaena sp. FACHB-2040]|uniref:zinc-binding dehydrogenase n=1 Tax=Pseudanabaena sp. FACHB-2040 TaxID=2692859 RepID=UPI0018EF5D61|nr:zinc-binding dehydrogenase [Pseudanabaena sp. FACHB-2040]